MIEELKKILNENEGNFDNPYNKQDDNSTPKTYQTRKKVLKLSDLNRLKKIRNQKREELAQDSVFIPILFGPDLQSQDEMGGLGGGLPPM